MNRSQLKVAYSPFTLSPPINCSADAYRFCFKIWDKDLIMLQEQIYVLYLNNNNEVIAWRLICTGTGRCNLFDMKFALACALGCMAEKIIIAHNHPSGVLKPSQLDIDLTLKLSSAASLLDIRLIEHLIISRKDYYSFVDHKIIKK